MWNSQRVDRMGEGEGTSRRIKNFFNYPSEILPGLYLGNIYNAADPVILDELGISTIVNVSRNITNYFESNYDYINIKIDDINSEKFDEDLIEVANKIKDILKLEKKVLVHCLMGSSRSATVVMMYMIIHKEMDVDSAYKFIKEKRHVININTSFMKQIREYYEKKEL